MFAASPEGSRVDAPTLAGGLACLVAIALFALVAQQVMHGASVPRIDEDLAHWLHRHATPALTSAMLVITNLHSTLAVGTYGAMAALALLWRRQGRAAVAVIVCVFGGLALNVALKLAFERARPTFDDPILVLATYSFPSGHVLGTTVLYGLMVAWAWSKTESVAWRALALFAGLSAIGLVSASRMILGVHYLSDTAAAFLEGIAWLALCLTALHVLWPRDPNPAAKPMR